MSGRVESSWPNLTKVGPSSSSISRRWRPRAGRFCASITVERRSACRSKTKPKPCLVATWAISRTRPIVRRRSASVAMGGMLEARRCLPLHGPGPGMRRVRPARRRPWSRCHSIAGSAGSRQASSSDSWLARSSPPRTRHTYTRPTCPCGAAGSDAARQPTMPSRTISMSRPVSSATSRTTPASGDSLDPSHPPGRPQRPSSARRSSRIRPPVVRDHRRRPHLRRGRAQVGGEALPHLGRRQAGELGVELVDDLAHAPVAPWSYSLSAYARPS